ncbi:Uncharacterized protein SCF082_LOCUS16816, partial [Durusdinium trenchii]
MMCGSMRRIFRCFVICQIWRLSHAVRGAAEVFDVSDRSPSEDECAFKAELTKLAELDAISVKLHEPDFTFFDSREFFLSPEPSCKEELEVGLRTAFVSKEAKRLQQQRRFKVKQIKESLNAANKTELDFPKELLKQMSSKGTAKLPAVDLHMFPERPLDIDSQWQVLLVPKARKVFGRTVYLCRPIVKNEVPCVAKLDFQPLPWRFMNLWNDWDPVLDPQR